MLFHRRGFCGLARLFVTKVWVREIINDGVDASTRKFQSFFRIFDSHVCAISCFSLYVLYLMHCIIRLLTGGNKDLLFFSPLKPSY